MSEDSLLSFFAKSPTRVKLRLSFFFTTGVTVIVVAGFIIGTVYKYHRSPSVTEQVLTKSREVASAAPVQPYQYPYEIKDISIVLMNKNATRTAYAQFTLILDCPDEESKKAMTLHRARLLDTIFEVGSNFYIEDFTPTSAVKSFDRFKGGIRDSYAKFFKSQAPRDVVLKDWFVN